MEYFLGVLLFAACSFILALFYLNVSPTGFLYAVAKRLINPPEYLRPVVRDAPYHRVGMAANGFHRPILLNLETSDGSGQACHPDVVYIPGGFGLKKWPYWMVCTPYPYGDSYFENPEIFVSWDGLTWAIPNGVQNPLVPSLKNAGDHNSDPDILFHNNELWLFYRETLRSRTPNENKVFLTKSADGMRWSRPVEILSERDGAQLLSPAVLHDGTQFVMWTIQVHGGDLKLMRRNSPNGLTWSAPAIGSVVGLNEGRHPWHIDVILEKDRLSAALVSCTRFGGGGSRIHYAYSVDQGLTWFADGFLLGQIYEFEANIQYRASLRKMEQDTHVYELWYSAASLRDMFSIAYMRLVRRENKVLPYEMPPTHIETLTSVK